MPEPKEPTLRGKGLEIGREVASALRGSLAERALEPTVIRPEPSSRLRGKGLEIGASAEKDTTPTSYISVKNGRRYTVIEKDKTTPWGKVITRLRNTEDGSTVNISADTFDERFTPEL